MCISNLLKSSIITSLASLIVFVPQDKPITTVDGLGFEHKTVTTQITAIQSDFKPQSVKVSAQAPKPAETKSSAPTNYINGSGVPAIMIKIRGCESGHDYTAQNKESTASGAYQFVDGTWNGFKGYAKAKHAPPQVQDEYAIHIYKVSGTKPWVSSIGCWG